MDQVDIGMIGAGNHANEVHYPSLAEIPDARIAAICDLDENRLNSTANKYGIKERFTDYKRMLDEIDLDAVYIIMLPHLLDPLVTYCLKRKKHVFVEKPPGMSLEETKKWAEDAKTNSCLTMVAFNRRFVPIAMEAKKIVEESSPITQCLVTFHKYTAPGSWDRYVDKIKELYDSTIIGPYLGDVCHAIDLLRWAGSEVKEIYSYVSKHYSPHVNTYNAFAIFESGAIGILNTNRSSGTRVHSIELQSKSTWAFVDLGREPDKSNAIIYRKRSSQQVISSKALGELKGYSADSWKPLYRFYGYLDESIHFIQCIKERKQPQTSFEDAAKTMELILKIQAGKETPPIM